MLKFRLIQIMLPLCLLEIVDSNYSFFIYSARRNTIFADPQTPTLVVSTRETKYLLFYSVFICTVLLYKVLVITCCACTLPCTVLFLLVLLSICTGVSYSTPTVRSTGTSTTTSIVYHIVQYIK
jgi:hypothetical protein